MEEEFRGGKDGECGGGGDDDDDDDDNEETKTEL